MDWKDLERDPVKGMLIGLFLFVLGLTLVWPVQAIVVSSNEKATYQSISSAHQAIDQAQQLMNEQARWYLPSYMIMPDGQEMKDSLAWAENELSGEGGAEKTAAKCHQGWPSKRISCFRDAASKASWAMHNATEANKVLATNTSNKLRAQEGLKSFSTDPATLQLKQAQSQFQQEAPDHLVKYTDSVAGNLKDAAVKLAAVGDYFNQASYALPPDSDTQQKGDPLKAINELDQAKALVDEVNSLTSQVTSSLGALKTARTQVQSTTQQADGAIKIAEQVLNSINNQYGWGFDLALKPAAKSLREAKSWLESTRSTQTIQIQPEGKYDWMLAYSQAQDSLRGAQTAKDSAELQVKHYIGAMGKINQYNSYARATEVAVYNSENAESTLRSYHAADAWSSVSSNLSGARGQLADAANKIAMVKDYLAVTKQRFAEAETLADATLAELQQAKTNAIAVTELAATLEQYRSLWPSARNNAQNVIDQQSSDISSYGNYDPHAKDQYDQAVGLLSQAEGEAASKHYRPATNHAQQAASLAEGTGRQAHQAYDDYQAEQERLRKQAKEEARRQAEEAQRQAEEAARHAAEESSSSSSNSSETWNSGGWESNPSGGYADPSPSYEDNGGWDSSPSYEDSGGW